jgi:membrane-bound serine protease (ClpP class)
MIAFIAGSLMLIDTDLPGYGIPWPMVAGISVASALFLISVAGMALKSRRNPIVSGHEAMIGAVGEVLEGASGGGKSMVRVHGELWSAHSEKPLTRGQKVRVTGIDGLVLQVIPAEK